MANQDNLLVLMHFDGPNIVNDAEFISGVEVSSVVSGELSDVTSKFGDYSFEIQGEETYINFDSSTVSTVFLQNPFTIDGWVYVPSGEDFNEADLINLSADNNGDTQVVVNCYVYYDTDNYSWNLVNYFLDKKVSESYELEESVDYELSSVTTNAWHHYAVVKGNDDYIRIYWDGTLVATSTNEWTFPYVTNNNLSVSIYGSLGGNPIYLDEVRWIKEVLWTGSSFDVPTSPMDVDLRYTIGDFVSTSSWTSGTWQEEKTIDFPFHTVLLLQGDGSNGSTSIVDTSIKARSVSRYVATISTSSYKFPPGSIYFSGSNSYLTCSSSSDFAFGNNPFTIDFWFNPLSLPSSGTYKEFYSQSWSYSLKIKLHNNSGNYRISVTMTYGGGQWDAVSSNFPSLTTGTWHHVMVSYKNSKLYVGRDGSVSENNWSSSNNIPNSSVRIGGSSGYYFYGYIDSFRVVKGVAVWTEDYDTPTKRYSDVLQGQYDTKDFDTITYFGLNSLYNQNEVTFSDVSLLMHFDNNTKNEITGFTFDFYEYPMYMTAEGVFDKTLYVDDYCPLVLTGINSAFGTDDFSIDFFLEYGCSTSNPIFIQTDSSGDYYKFYVVSSGSEYTFRFDVYISGVLKRCSFNVSDIYYPNRRHYAVARYNDVTYCFIDGEMMASMTDTYSIYSFSNPLTFTPGSYLDELRIAKGKSSYTGGDFFVRTYPYNYEKEPVILDFIISDFLSSSAFYGLDVFFQIFQVADFLSSSSWILSCKILSKLATLYNTIFFLDGEGTTGGNPSDKSIWQVPLLYYSPGSKISDTRSKFGTKSIYVVWNDEKFRTQSGLLTKYRNLFDFRRNDFTIDFWHYYTHQSEDTYSDPSCLVEFYYNSSYGYFRICPGQKGQSYAVKYPGNCLNLGFLNMETGGSTLFQTEQQVYNEFILNKWVHFAITRVNDTFYVFINGQKVLEQYFEYDFPTPNTNYWFAFFHRMFGYIDNYRIINGIGLWTTDFDPNDIDYSVPLTSQSIFSAISSFDILYDIVKYEFDFGTYSEFDLQWLYYIKIDDFESILSFIYRSKYLTQWFSVNGFRLDNILVLKNAIQELLKTQDTFDIKTSIQFYQTKKDTLDIQNSFIQNVSDDFYIQNQFTQQTKSEFQSKNAVGFSPISGTLVIKNSIDKQIQAFFESFVYDETYLGV